jgi:E1-E2 ATPase
MKSIVLTYLLYLDSQKIDPVHGSTKILHLDEDDQIAPSSTQTGYKRTPVGVVLHLITLFMYFGWFALLAVVTTLVYKNEDDYGNYQTAYGWFCAVWNAGFVWSMTLSWPHSIRSLFLRRCLLSEATHVAVYHGFAPSQHANSDKKLELRLLPTVVVDFCTWIVMQHRKVMIMVFATPDARTDPNKGILKYCLVETNPDGTKYFMFVFRRYNFDLEKQSFVPASYKLGNTFAELAPKGATVIDILEAAYLQIVGDNTAENAPPIAHPSCFFGLTTRDVLQRRQAIGANIIEMEEPSFVKEFLSEVSKPFFLYQFYILWLWNAIYYYYMACLNLCIILIAATVISRFRYRSIKTLCAISKVHGSVSVFRDGKRVEINHSDLVPGDVVELGQGIIHCDMLLLTGFTIVDESSLTGEATPQAKVPIDPCSGQTYDPMEHKRETLFAGTTILECENSLALVVRIASYTKRGELMREIIAFRTHHFQMYIELPIVFGILSVYSACFFAYVFFNSGDDMIISWVLGM